MGFSNTGLVGLLPAIAATAATTTAVAATAAAATVETTAAAGTTATTAAAETTGAGFTRASFVHVQRPALQFAAVHRRHRIARLIRIRHFDEREPTGLSGFPVPHYAHFFHGAEFGKRAMQLVLGYVVGKVPYKYIGHLTPAFATLWR
jgi:hypothetical protein